MGSFRAAALRAAALQPTSSWLSKGIFTAAAAAGPLIVKDALRTIKQINTPTLEARSSPLKGWAAAQPLRLELHCY